MILLPKIDPFTKENTALIIDAFEILINFLSSLFWLKLGIKNTILDRLPFGNFVWRLLINHLLLLGYFLTSFTESGSLFEGNALQILKKLKLCNFYSILFYNSRSKQHMILLPKIDPFAISYFVAKNAAPNIDTFEISINFLSSLFWLKLGRRNKILDRPPSGSFLWPLHIIMTQPKVLTLGSWSTW